MDSFNVFYFFEFICWNYDHYVLLEFKKKTRESTGGE